MIKLEGGVSVDSSDSNNEKDAERDTPGSDEAGGGDEKDKKNNRGNYRCSRCNLPKKGHVCPYQAIIRKRESIPNHFVDVEVQAELDNEMTLACLGPLELQGLPESYLVTFPQIRERQPDDDEEPNENDENDESDENDENDENNESNENKENQENNENNDEDNENNEKSE